MSVAMWKNVDMLTEAFRHGGGVPQEAYGEEFWCGFERFTRPSMNYLTYQVTIEDPKVLTKPWTSAPHRYTLNHEEMLEWYCPAEVHPAADPGSARIGSLRRRGPDLARPRLQDPLHRHRVGA